MSARIEAELNEDGELTHFVMEGSLFGLLALARFIANEADGDMIAALMPDDDDGHEPIKVGFTQ
jgi:hypothetical protein